MAWPQSLDYNAAVQNPADSFSDPDLARGQLACDTLGLPRVCSGAFADVYQIVGPDNQSWAVKCFTRPVPNRRQRFRAISEHLGSVRRPFIVDFTYLEQGISIGNEWYPVLKMRWVEGFTLNEYVREQAGKPAVMHRLAQLWLRLARELRESDVAHGDLQHGNVLLVPGRTTGALAVRLIDYDGIFVPALAKKPAIEIGHLNYQHPQRMREGGYDIEMDCFAHLVIYTALRALAVGGRSLWDAFDTSENMLFRESDFVEPNESKLWPELLNMEDFAVRRLAGHLLQSLRRPRAETPTLEQIAPAGQVRPFNIGGQAAVRSWLGMAGANPWLWQPPPPPPQPSLMPLGAVVMTAGKPQTLAIKIDRHGFLGHLMVRCEEVPDAIKVDGGLVEENENEIVILFKADLSAELPALPVIVSLWDGDTQLDERQFSLTVNVAAVPRLAKLAPIKLRAGDARRLMIPVEYNGWKKPVSLRVEGLPQGVTSVDTEPTTTAFVPLRLKVRPEAKPITGVATLTLWSGNSRVDAKQLTISVETAAPSAAPTAEG